MSRATPRSATQPEAALERAVEDTAFSAYLAGIARGGYRTVSFIPVRIGAFEGRVTDVVAARIGDAGATTA